MITRIELENFKGICDRASLNLRPITLLFGANSSGKSTIIQALHYALEIFRHRNFDADRTTLGGRSVDLGGFQSMVHAHDLDKRITMLFAIDVSDSTLPDHTVGNTDLTPESPGFAGAPDMDDQIMTVWARIEVGWSLALRAPQVFVYEVGVNDRETPVIRIDASAGKGQPATLSLHVDDALFTRPNSEPDEATPLLQHLADADVGVSPDRRASFPIYDQPSAIPNWGRPLRIWATSDMEPIPDALIELRRLLSKLAVGIGEQLLAQLERMLYVGPLRVVPPRSYQPPLTEDLSRWADGLGAWDALYRRGPHLPSRVSEWMTRLGAGYRIELRKVFELPEAIRDVDHELTYIVNTALHDDEGNVRLSRAQFDCFRRVAEVVREARERTDLVLIDERNGVAVRPYDVGVGISQVLPIIVAALYRGERGAGAFVTIEQPELHIHPRLQVALADLFIEQSTRGTSSDHWFLLETHSEHLMLRLMRRIRGSSEADAGSTEDGEERLRLPPHHVGVIYVQRDDDGAVRFVPLELDSSGEFRDVWPEGFFDERLRELY
ncbi:DUF3696 domain-containing protein [Polyangium sp. 15x6]|uniref:AAA family ATPase n=1 Tax=Polyangium sp. 15x6 TaxID=3042687 RepID=UPI00249A273D|nr:DUF3696 domain-containing protein [Polyangium sp. 15x6]MDI3289761.1 DUF3696 domain-containing protein [Polyangium sp. 15x6]